MRSILDYLKITLKGIAMGMADVVPGVSGGTIAFITGIYEELINSIKSVDLDSLKLLLKLDFVGFWKKINGNFLLSLVTGIAISIFSLSKIILYLLENQPVLLWSFFFGLILSSILLIGGQIKEWNTRIVVSIILGTIISFYITIAEPASSPESIYYIFFSGFIAIIAMILPGVSGAFILLLLGSYASVLGAVDGLRVALSSSDIEMLVTNLSLIAVFMVGAVLGLMSFSRVLSWMFKHYHNSTLAVLTGFMIGSLNKVWPWKETISTRINSHGEEVPFLQESVLPNNFNGDPQLMYSLLLMVFGFALIYLLENYSSNKE